MQTHCDLESGAPRHRNAVRATLAPTVVVCQHPEMSERISQSLARNSAWYSAAISAFIGESEDAILGRLTAASQFDVDRSQRDAWLGEILLLKRTLTDIDGWMHLEFDVPRLGSRIDAVVVTSSAVIPIEFKIGEAEYRRADFEQAWDYALDLKNFHEASHNAELFPMLVATKADSADERWASPEADGVRRPRRCSATTIRAAILDAIADSSQARIDVEQWGRSPYRPTPTIIQAARALYAGHAVDAIARSDAGATNLATTSRRVEAIVDEVRRVGAKAIIFITGVPGAGKTLVGLDLATRRRAKGETHAVYLSGNDPLVAVLREALTRDQVVRGKANGLSERKGAVAQRVKAFIQNVHHFRDEGLRDDELPPADHVVIFDESQRAWTKEKTSDFMRRRKNRPGFDQSEPEFLLRYMNRRADWAVVVCLVGGGQEIHTGEAGIGEWLSAVRTSFPDWHVYISPNLGDSEYSAEAAIVALEKTTPVRREPHLHLAVSMRSFRAGRVSSFVKAVLDGELQEANRWLAEFQARYPVVMCRDLDRARRWIRARARGSERSGLVASSQAMRLKPHAIDVRVSIDPVHYFLNDPLDTRASSFLEDAATEFQIQGLELDWACVSWDADLRRTNGEWSHHSFRGDAWINIRSSDRRRYQLNAYRVLLTRARQGMVIFVPPGDDGDATRQPGFYDGTYQYLRNAGVPSLE